MSHVMGNPARLRQLRGLRTAAGAPDGEIGGPDRDQTDDLVVANDALYQLSYRPVQEGT
jgi:hypothetical protein